MKHSITIEIDTDGLRNLEDSHLAAFWQVAQLNPVSRDDMGASRLVADLQAEIIRRWLERAPTLQYNRTSDTSAWETLRKHGSWSGPAHDTWVYEPGKAEREATGGAA